MDEKETPAHTAEDLTEWGNRFADYCRELTETGALKKDTAHHYQLKVQLFINWWREQPHQPVLTTGTVDRFFTDLLTAQSPNYGTWSESSLGLFTVALRRWGQFLYTQQLLPTHPFSNLKSPRHHTQWNVTFLNEADITKLLSVHDSTQFPQLRTATMLFLMIRTGLRPSELSRIQLRDLRRQGDEAILSVRTTGVRSKNASKKDDITITADVTAALDNYLQARIHHGESLTDESPLFGRLEGKMMLPLTSQSIRLQIRLAYRRAGLLAPKQAATNTQPIRRSRLETIPPKLTIRSLRLSTGLHLKRAGGDLSEAQQLLRHRNLRTTKALFDQDHRFKKAPTRRLLHLGQAPTTPEPPTPA